MTTETLYRYIQLQIPQRTRAMMMSQFMPGVFVPDPYNSHYDDRRTWLAWRDPDPPRVPTRQRLGRALVRLGTWLEGRRPAPAASSTP